MSDEFKEPRVGVLVPYGELSWLELHSDIHSYINRTWPDMILNTGGAYEYDWDMDVLQDHGIMVYFHDRAKAMAFRLALRL